MADVKDLLSSIGGLCSQASNVSEESFRLTLEGEALSESIRGVLSDVFSQMESLQIPSPTLKDAETNETIEFEDLSTDEFDGVAWRLVFGKTPVADLMKARDDENTLVFFSVSGFHDWLNEWDPFLQPRGSRPDFSRATTIRVNGLSSSVGGPLLWVMPPDGEATGVEKLRLPSADEVNGLIHTNATRALRVCPEGYAISWGDADNSCFSPLLRLSAKVLSACLLHELRETEECYLATLLGTKKVSLPLCDGNQEISSKTLETLVETVRWVYEERPETRLGLVMDRLSIDVDSSKSLLSGIELHLQAALSQARDSYAFVILERKDAYHKEVRELMKDMKAQADLYAAKVRSLVNALTRDALGILVFIAFSFIGKFDKNNFQELLVSQELALLVKVLSGYLVVSFFLQLFVNLRDVQLADKESRIWLDVLQHYSSQNDKKNRFLDPIARRRRTVYGALVVAFLSYGALAWGTWNLPDLISGWMNQGPVESAESVADAGTTSN